MIVCVRIGFETLLLMVILFLVLLPIAIFISRFFTFKTDKKKTNTILIIAVTMAVIGFGVCGRLV